MGTIDVLAYQLFAGIGATALLSAISYVWPYSYVIAGVVGLYTLVTFFIFVGAVIYNEIKKYL